MPGREKIAFLRRLVLLQGLDDDALMRVGARARPARFTRSELLCQENSPPDRLHMIRSGVVQLFVTDASALRRVIAHLRRADTVGESALITGDPAPASAVALTNVETWTLSRAQFEDLVLTTPQIGLHVMRALAQRLHRATGAFEGLDHAKGPHLIPVLALEPGLGRTTLAINLATALAQMREGRVLLYDPNIAATGISKALGISSDADYVDGLLRRESLDVERNVWRTKGGFSTLLPPRSGGQLLKEVHLFVVLHALRDKFDIVVTDSSSVLASLNTHVVGAATRIILLMRAGTPGTLPAYRQFEDVVLKPQGIGRERILIGMVGGPVPALPGRSLPADVRTFQLSWEPDLMERCRVALEVAVLESPQSAYAAAITGVARGLVYDQTILIEVPAGAMGHSDRACVASNLVERLGEFFAGVRMGECDRTQAGGEGAGEGPIRIHALSTRRVLSSRVDDVVTILTDLRTRRGLTPITLSINGRPSLL